MVTQTKKKIPCEECRDQKRKCNGEIPCERCAKFNLNCVYTSTRSPSDEEYLELARQTILLQQIETLNHQMNDIEISMTEVASKCNYSIGSSTPPLMVDDRSLSSFEDTNSVSCIASMIEPPLKRIKLIESNDIHAYLTTDQEEHDNAKRVKPWTLTLQKGEMSVQTHVHTYTDLMDNLHHMMGAVELGVEIPPLFKNSVQQNSLVGILNTMIRKKYGKTHCKNVARSVRIFITPDLSTVSTMIVYSSPDPIQVTTEKLLRAYLRCQHLQQLAIHVRSFIRLFTDKEETSPAAMALCAAICTCRCKHVAECLPSISLVEYGKFYFERARDLLSDHFDHADLETLTSYTFMAIYKFTVSQTSEALLYADMAERIQLQLKPHYEAVTKDPAARMEEKGEAVHFKRLLNHLHRVITFEQISRANPAEAAKSNTKDLPFCTLLQMGEGTWEKAEDDSMQEKWFAEMHGHVLQLQRASHEASKFAQSSDLQHLVGLISHQIEMSMRHWYHNVLPAEFKLSLPLFDSTVSCKEFYATMERECAHSALPALTTLALYEEWLVLGQSYAPKKVPAPQEDWGILNKVWGGGPTLLAQQDNRKWNRRLDKLMEMRQMIDFEGTDQEFLAAVNQMIGPLDMRINVHVITLSIHAAFNTIRILKYLRSRSQDCYFDIKKLLNAWQMLLIVSKLQDLMPPEIMEYMPKVHQQLTACMTIVKEELLLQPYQGTVGDYVLEMESDLRSQVLKDDDDCDCVACPNA